MTRQPSALLNAAVEDSQHPHAMSIDRTEPISVLGRAANIGPSGNSSEKRMVDGQHQTCRSDAGDTSSDGSSYAALERSRLISSADISAMFGKPPDWFSRDRVRKSLYARNFPGPVLGGHWLRSAVDAWLEREGKRPR